MMLTAMAIEKAGSTNGPAIREGYYKIERYEWLIKTYSKPFTPENHDAVNENDYVSTQFIATGIVPVGMKKSSRGVREEPTAAEGGRFRSRRSSQNDVRNYCGRRCQVFRLI